MNTGFRPDFLNIQGTQVRFHQQLSGRNTQRRLDIKTKENTDNANIRKSASTSRLPKTITPRLQHRPTQSAPAPDPTMSQKPKKGTQSQIKPTHRKPVQGALFTKRTSHWHSPIKKGKPMMLHSGSAPRLQSMANPHNVRGLDQTHDLGYTQYPSGFSTPVRHTRVKHDFGGPTGRSGSRPHTAVNRKASPKSTPKTPSASNRSVTSKAASVSSDIPQEEKRTSPKVTVGVEHKSPSSPKKETLPKEARGGSVRKRNKQEKAAKTVAWLNREIKNQFFYRQNSSLTKNLQDLSEKLEKGTLSPQNIQRLKNIVKGVKIKRVERHNEEAGKRLKEIKTKLFPPKPVALHRRVSTTPAQRQLLNQNLSRIRTSQLMLLIDLNISTALQTSRSDQSTER